MKIDVFTMGIPAYGADLTCRVMLPDGYESQTKAYPVVYIQDGQTVFRDEDEMPTCALKESMRYTDYYRDYRETLPEVIVVGIDCLEDGKARTLAYSPDERTSVIGGDGKEEIFEGNGGTYGDWLVNTLKPEIDRRYRTRPEKEATAIGGFSSGASCALYITLRYPEVFSKLFMFGSAVWLWDFYFRDAVASCKGSPVRELYMACGTAETSRIGNADWTLGANREIFDLLLESGVPKEHARFYEIRDGYHAIWQWRPYFPDALRWIFRQQQD